MQKPLRPIFYVCLVADIALLLIAFSVLIGWQLNSPTLKSWVTGVTPMNPVTASFLVLSGVWTMLFLYNRGFQLRKIISITIILFGLIHFITYFFPTPGIRMDFLLYGDRIRNSGIPNLIAPNTALNFILCGVAMVTTIHPQKRLQYQRQVILTISFLLVYISLLGYLFNIQPAYRFGGLTPMALNTSVAFLFLVILLFFLNTTVGVAKLYVSRYNGGLLMRRAVPFVLLVPPFLEYIRFYAEKRGYFTGEFGVELSSFVFTIALLVFIILYSAIINHSQKKELEASLRYRVLMESLHEAVLEFDKEGKIVYVNPAFERILGYSKKDVMGRAAIDMLVPHKDRATFVQRLKERSEGKSEVYTAELLTKNSTKRFISIHANPLPSPGGGISGTVLSLNDITDAKMHLQDLEAFTASAAHDLNSPLASIQMLLQSIDKSGLNEEQSTLINFTVETSKRMSQLLVDLLQFYRWGDKELKKQMTDTGWIVRETLDLFDTSKTEIELEKLPPVFANEAALRQLFTNLISNALKYSAKNEKPRIEIRSFTRHNETWFSISDNGIGIDEAYLPQLFTPFKRFTSGFEGNGLGLAIVRRIIEKHGGSIIAKNNAEGGMRFEFTFAQQR